VTAIPCTDLDEAVAYFTERLGFRIETIFPADDPRVAVVSGHGLTLRLEASAAPTVRPPGAWVEGRAGMRYRDLIPGRLGGRLIASHIQIPGGGPVPDYVHYHRVRFQMIHCWKGWVRVVYEDQGPPFVMHAGDCVLQPPEIRHRVLESSPGCEVIEITAPADHVTVANHDLPLPTSQVRPDRDFGGQRFVRGHAGIAAASNGLAMVWTARGPLAGRHDGELLFLFVLHGKALLDPAGSVPKPLAEGDAVVIPAGQTYHVTDAGGDLELLSVALAQSLAC
jgi:quercetin dioxygenase-like cupin family protein